MRFQHTEPDPETLLTTSKLYYIAYHLYKGRITLHQALLEFAAWVDQDFREDIAQAAYSRKALFFFTWILARFLLSAYRGTRWLFFEQIVIKALVPYLFLPVYSFLALKWVRLLFSPQELRQELLKELEKELENRGFSPSKNRSRLSFRERAELLVFDLFYHLARLSELTGKEFFQRSRKTVFLLTSLAIHLLILLFLSYSKPTGYDLSEGRNLDLDSIEIVEIGTGTLKKKAKRKPESARKQAPAAKILKKIARLKPENQPPKPPPPSRERIPQKPKTTSPEKLQPKLARKIAMIQKRTGAMIKRLPVSKRAEPGKKYRRPAFKPKKMMPPITEKATPQKKLPIRKIFPGKVASTQKLKKPVLNRLVFLPKGSQPAMKQPGLPREKTSRIFKRDTVRGRTEKLLPSVIGKKQAVKSEPAAAAARESKVVIKMSEIGQRRINLSRDRELSSKRFEISRLEKREKKLGAAKSKLTISKMNLEESLARKALDNNSMVQRKIGVKEKLLLTEKEDSDFKLERSEHYLNRQSKIDQSRKFQTIDVDEKSETLKNRHQEAFFSETKKQKAAARERISLSLPFMESKTAIKDIPQKQLAKMILGSSAPKQERESFSRKIKLDQKAHTIAELTPAREKPIKGITSYDQFEKNKKAMETPEITLASPGNDMETVNPGVTYLASTGKQSFSAVETKDNLKVGLQPEAVSATALKKTRTLADSSQTGRTQGKTLAFADKMGEQALEKLLESPIVSHQSMRTRKLDKRKLGSMKIDLNLPSGMITKEALFILTGKMDKEAKVAWIKINGVTQLAAVVGGRLMAELTMKKGINEIEVSAFSSSGAFGRKKAKILFRPSRQIPVITLISPPIQLEKAEKGQAIQVKGEINDPSITRAVLFLNRRPVMLIVKGGKFSKKVILPGKRLNTFRIMATNKMGVKGYSPMHTVVVGASINVMNPRPF